MQEPPIHIPLDDLGVVRVHGADTVQFLQGQLSNDVTRLVPGHSLLAGYHNPQGRTIAVLQLIGLAADDVLAVLPRELAATVASRLTRFVLRSKVKITDESSAWRVAGVVGPNAAPAGTAARVDATRWLTISPLDAPALHTGERTAWHRLDVESGRAQVFAATSEEFVAQMLNLDLLEAISFDKGCYTGQEVIARAHYRGKVKRRMQRFVSRAALDLAPGSAGKLADGRPFKVVDAVRRDDGRCEFLAVAPIARGEPEPSESPQVDADPLPLPYRLPD
jgi:tRNA-modifying protein YgfZ